MTTDPKDAEIARLRMALAESEAAAEGALMILTQTQAERDAALAQMDAAWHLAWNGATPMTTDTKDTEQARKALHKAEKEYCSNFDKGPVFIWADKGTVFHWAERGAYMLKADAQAEIARLREERDRFEAALGRACQVGGTTYLVERAEKAEAERDEARTDLGRIIMSLPTGKGERAAGAVEGVKMMRARLEAARDAALAQVARLHHLIHEASDPDFLWGAMDNVNDMDADITEFANAASRAIRASIPILAAAEREASP